MPKILLTLIITLSLALTSGMGTSQGSHDKLSNSLEVLQARIIKAQITAIVPLEPDVAAKELRIEGTGGLVTKREVSGDDGTKYRVYTYDGLGANGLAGVYTGIRSKVLALNGGAELKLSAELPQSSMDPSQLGRHILYKLGANRLLQEIDDSVSYSGAAFLPDWGPPITVGDDQMNVEVYTRLDNNSGKLLLYIIAPVLAGDL